MLKDVKKQTVASIHSFLNNDVHSILDTAPAIDGFRVLRDKVGCACCLVADVSVASSLQRLLYSA